MGLFDSLFGKQIKLEHEFFGTMLFRQHKRAPIKNYFTCRRHFAPSDKIIDILIDADITGPSLKQIDFFKRIEDNYAAIAKAIIPLIEDEFRNWKPDFKINDFQKEFEPVHLHLLRFEREPFVWEIAFESDHDRNHTFTLTMSNFEAMEVLIDG